MNDEVQKRLEFKNLKIAWSLKCIVTVPSPLFPCIFLLLRKKNHSVQEFRDEKIISKVYFDNRSIIDVRADGFSFYTHIL